MTSVHRDGIEIPFTVDGEGAPRTLVYAHGLMGVASQDREGLAPLLEHGWRVVTFCQRGHTKATPVTEPSLYDSEAMGADLWAVCDAVGAERCWIGGGSMGAATSFRAARAHPERVEGLVQVIPAIRDKPHEIVPIFDLLADRLRDAGMAGLIQSIKDFAIQFGASPDELDYLEDLHQHHPRSLETALRAVPRWILDDVPSGFVDLPFPVIVVGWEGDPVHPLQTAVDIASAAGTEVVMSDMSAQRSDRSLLGKQLVEALGVGSIPS